ncbi:MAG: alanine racemase [Propionibacteriales bacterium]|nr:alanine racemase [Propionibacteriales bacterium]
MSGVTLTIDGSAWRDHLRAMLSANPGLVPVAKGNGYGFGLARLAEESATLGVDCIAVGVAAEVAQVSDAYEGDIVVLTPWRQGDALAHQITSNPRVITTVSRLADLELITADGSRSRVVVEVQTSMRRHGIPVAELPRVADLLDKISFAGWVIHLPHAETGRLAEAQSLARAANAVRSAPIWFSHIKHADAHRITEELGVELKLRIGTQLWLGAPTTRTVTATVIDVHKINKGDKVGYWQRRVPHNGWLVIVAGGTANGIAMEAPTSAKTPRARLVSVATGGLAALGRALSPYTIAGKKRWFAEPPHMQSSLILLPAGVTPPELGDEIPVEVRLTTAVVDQTLIN